MKLRDETNHPVFDELSMPVRSFSMAFPEWVDDVVDWTRSFKSDEEKMSLAIELSRLNVRLRSGGPFGTAIFDRRTGFPVAVGLNSVTRERNAVLHGEVTAIMTAQRRVSSFTLGGEMACELFTSCEPCAMCLGAILWSGVRRLVCAATGDDARSIGFDEGPVFPESFAYLERSGIEVVRGLLRDEARKVLSNYVNSGGLIYNP